MTPYERHLFKLKEKFQMDKLELETRASARPERTLEQIFTDQEKAESKSWRECYGSARYQRKRLGMALLVRLFG